MMRDMHSTLSDEHEERAEAEQAASQIEVKLVNMSQNVSKMASKVAKFKSLLIQTNSTNMDLTSALNQAHMETEKLRQKLDRLKQISKKKTKELKKQVKYFQDLDLADKAADAALLNKTKKKDVGEIEKLKKELTEKLQQSEALRLSQKKKAFELYAKTATRVKELEEENTKIKLQYVKHHKLFERVQSKVRMAEDKVKSEHRDAVEAQEAAKAAQDQLQAGATELRKKYKRAEIAALQKIKKQYAAEVARKEKAKNKFSSELDAAH